MTATANTRSLPVPSAYAFDDTPKAFKRMLQRKNGDPDAYKKSKQQPVETSFKRTADSSSSNSTGYASSSTQKHNPQVVADTKKAYTNTATSAAATGFKTVRAKRKAHLQSRDLKKKLKRFDAAREQPAHPSHTRKHVRDVVQEPPKLHQLKKAFKKVKDDREQLKSWSDYEDELEAEEFEKAMENTKFKKNK